MCVCVCVLGAGVAHPPSLLQPRARDTDHRDLFLHSRHAYLANGRKLGIKIETYSMRSAAGLGEIQHRPLARPPLLSSAGTHSCSD